MHYTTSFVCANLIFSLNSSNFYQRRNTRLLLLQATLWMARAEKLKELMAQREALTAEQVQTPEDLSKFFFFKFHFNILNKKETNFCIWILKLLFVYFYFSETFVFVLARQVIAACSRRRRLRDTSHVHFPSHHWRIAWSRAVNLQVVWKIHDDAKYVYKI